MAFSNEFLSKFSAKRDQLGDKEYDKSELQRYAHRLLKEDEASLDFLAWQTAIKFVDDVQRKEEKAAPQPTLAFYETHVALGDGKRVKVGKADYDQAMRRKQVIDRNKMAQDEAWAKQTKFWNSALDALRSSEHGRLIEDVMPANDSMPANDNAPVADRDAA